MSHAKAQRRKEGHFASIVRVDIADARMHCIGESLKSNAKGIKKNLTKNMNYINKLHIQKYKHQITLCAFASLRETKKHRILARECRPYAQSRYDEDLRC